MTIADGEYKSYIGIEDVYYATITEDSSSAYTAGTPASLAPVLEMSIEPNTSSETQYADNAAFDTATTTGETKITINVTNIPHETLATLLGLVFDATNGLVYDNEAVPPYVALGFRSLKANGKYRYYWFYKGRFEAPKEAVKTKGESVEFQPQELTYTAIQTTHEWALSALVTDALKRIMGDEDTASFSATGWFSAVKAPMYTP